MLWDATEQRGATSGGSALRSTGGTLELGVSFQHELSDELTLELALVPRVQGTTASNGQGYFSDAAFQRFSFPLYVSFPIGL
jgi:hypothetical protein